MADLRDVSAAPPRSPSPSARPLNVERRYVGLADAGRATGLSRSYLWQLVTSGALPAYRVGKRILVAVDDLDDYIRRIPA